ncbi:MAG: hypothetical protein H6570_17750 [Lewinellaceae bacterium]|nr:hypothetical protein [Lewinellaceae bacterium]
MKHRRRSAVGTADFFYAQHIKIQVNKMIRGYATRISIVNYCNFNPEMGKSRRLDTSCSGGFWFTGYVPIRWISSLGRLQPLD